MSAAVVVGLLLAGCAEIPTAGPVVAGNPVRAQDHPPYVAFGAAAPRPGDDPAGIVDGFIDAMSAYHPGYEIAKAFLTPELSSTWDPSEGILVHRGSRPGIEMIDDGLVRVTMKVAGEVTPDGRYVPADADDIREIELSMSEVEGEWRIADAPDGTVISEDNFAREFEAYDVCFFDPEFSVFVPDPAYVPKNGQPATLLAQMLLDGPSEWLDPAVRTAFPESVTLSVSSVPVESGTATVELSENAQETQPAQRERMAAQLACTLGGLLEVSEVAMNADGISLLGQGEASVGVNDYERYDADQARAGGLLYGVFEGSAVVRLPEGGISSVAGPFGAASDISEIAVDTGGNRGLAVTEFGTELQVATFAADEARRTIAEGVALTSPVWDRKGLAWAVDQAETGGELVVVHPDDRLVELQDADLDGLDLARLSVSPDGTRVALVAGGRAYLALVVRDGEDPDALAVERPRSIGPEGEALDVAWSVNDEIVVLTRPEDGAPEVSVVDVFGAVQSLPGPVPGAVSLASGPERRHVVATEDGVLLEHESRTRWVNVGEGTAPMYP